MLNHITLLSIPEDDEMIAFPVNNIFLLTFSAHKQHSMHCTIENYIPKNIFQCQSANLKHDLLHLAQLPMLTNST